MLLPYAKCQTVLEAIVPFSNRRDGLSGCGVNPHCNGVAGREQIEPAQRVCKSKWPPLRSARCVQPRTWYKLAFRSAEHFARPRNPEEQSMYNPRVKRIHLANIVLCAAFLGSPYLMAMPG